MPDEIYYCYNPECNWTGTEDEILIIINQYHPRDVKGYRFGCPRCTHNVFPKGDEE